MTDLNDLFKVIAEGKKDYEENNPQGKIIKEVKDNVKSDLSKLFEELAALEKQVAKIEEENAIDEISKLVAEETLQATDPELNTVKIPQSVELPTPEENKIGTKYAVDRYLKTASFQQPDPDTVSKDVDDIRAKIKFLEQAIGRIAATGPGSGAAEIYNLDMPTKTVTGDYTIGRKDYYIGVNHDVKTYITLPEIGSNVKNGRIVVIKDESGHAQLTPIKIVGTIDNDPNGAEIRINNGAVQLLYSNGQWRII